MSFFTDDKVDMFRLRAITFFALQASAALLKRSNDGIELKDDDNLIAFILDDLSTEIDVQFKTLEEATITFPVEDKVKKVARAAV